MPMPTRNETARRRLGAWPALLLYAMLACAGSVNVNPADAQVIGFDQCEYTLPFGVPTDMHMSYWGPTPITGAAVRLTGIPTAWIRIVTPPATVDPCGPGGCDLFGNGAFLAFPSCQTDDPLTLFTITVVPTTIESDLTFSPEKTLDSPIDCPYVTHCDEPVFTRQCVACDQAFVNWSSPPGCPVPVEEITWTSVRRLYR